MANDPLIRGKAATSSEVLVSRVPGATGDGPVDANGGESLHAAARIPHTTTSERFLMLMRPPFARISVGPSRLCNAARESRQCVAFLEPFPISLVKAGGLK
jgi:hypothetical protein